LHPAKTRGKGQNEWQTLDIALIGRRIAVVVNDKAVICDQEIPGWTSFIKPRLSQLLIAIQNHDI